MDLSELKECVEHGLEASVSGIARAYPGERMIGFALGTDDDLRTLFSVACTAESAARSSEYDVRYVFTDWDRALDDDPMALASRLMAQTDFGYREAVWALLIESVATARARGLLADDVFVTVGSTDPGPELEKRERAAIVRLNPPHVVRSYRQWQLDESRSWLDELRAKPRSAWSYADIDREQTLVAEIAQLEAELAE
jgi:hypothetical protein